MFFFNKCDFFSWMRTTFVLTHSLPCTKMFVLCINGRFSLVLEDEMVYRQYPLKNVSFKSPIYNNHTHTHTHARAREPFNLYLLEHVRANVVYLATEPSIHLRRASDSESSNLPVTSPLIISSNTESSA